MAGAVERDRPARTDRRRRARERGEQRTELDDALEHAGEPRVAEYQDWLRTAFERVRPFGTGGSYVNFQTADEGDDRVRASYGANYDRLVEVKRRWDPGNLFRANRNIRP